MKAIINGIRYDTDKATTIGDAHGGSPYRSDFQFWEATLYVTPRSGRYFVAGEGGPLSPYSRSAGQNSWTGGSRIDPMTKEAAFEWAQMNLPAEIVETHFGGLVEDA